MLSIDPFSPLPLFTWVHTHSKDDLNMVRKKRSIYGFSGKSWVLITMASRSSGTPVPRTKTLAKEIAGIVSYTAVSDCVSLKGETFRAAGSPWPLTNLRSGYAIPASLNGSDDQASLLLLTGRMVQNEYSFFSLLACSSEPTLSPPRRLHRG